MFPFLPCTTISVSGITGSGKSCWVYELLKNKDTMFGESTPIIKILYCYGVWQELFTTMESSNLPIKFHEGLPTDEDIQDLTASKQHSCLILDDLLHEIVNKNSKMESLWTRMSHHKAMTIIFLTQNIFQKGARTINLNTHYTILFKNPRDIMQVSTLARQTGYGQTLVESFKDSTSSPYGYLIVDLHPNSDDDYRLRSKVFPGEDTVIYKRR
jgi:hypothetical protein